MWPNIQYHQNQLASQRLEPIFPNYQQQQEMLPNTKNMKILPSLESHENRFLEPGPP
jgi:hypothetical protein